MKRLIAFLLILISFPCFGADRESLIIPRLKYSGGGNWYVGGTAMPNLLRELNLRLGISTRPENTYVSPTDPEIYRYPMVFVTGNGRIKFKDQDLNSLTSYLNNGGFMWINDSYGMEKYVKQEIKRLYPDKQLVKLPKDHELFNNVYEFPDGLPKIHEHDGKPPVAYGLFDKGRMKILYLLESDIGDGLEDQGIHKVDTPEIREQAMRMAINIVAYAMMQ